MSPTTPSSPPPATPEDNEALAAEVAIGVLEAAEAGAAERRMESDAAFAELVWTWRARLAPLAERVAWVEPDPALWGRIEAALDRPAGPAPEGAGAEVTRLRRALRRWRAAAFLTGALAAAAVLLVIMPPPAPPQPARFVALLTPPGEAGAGWIAAVDIDARQIALVPVGGTAAPAGGAHELWYIADADSAPRSLGVIDGAARITAPPALAKGGTLAVSLEPPGGSPTGRPMGPVVYVGELRPTE